MSKLPFSVYDTFAYLASGFIVAMAADFAFGIGLRGETDPAVVDALFWILVVYIGGHLVAHLSSVLLEKGIVRKWLRSPEEHLLADEPCTLRKAKLFKSHYQQLPATVRERITARAGEDAITPGGRGFFLHCHALAQQQPAVRERLASFLNLYGFCRNASFALFVGAILLAVGAFVHSPSPLWWVPDGSRLAWAVAALLAGLGMFIRYLKFFCHYTTEVFTEYAARLPQPSPR